MIGDKSGEGPIGGSAPSDDRDTSVQVSWPLLPIIAAPDWKWYIIPMLAALLNYWRYCASSALEKDEGLQGDVLLSEIVYIFAEKVCSYQEEEQPRVSSTRCNDRN